MVKRDWVFNKARLEFKQNKNESNVEQIDFLYRVGLSHLESVQVQAQHLSKIMPQEPRLKLSEMKYWDTSR